ncbi:hypothetical protein DOY81_013453 [Sarcophaga bullata]|nr:hypothetical protein DOY81_013453 [Sarcophaga bullata]
MFTRNLLKIVLSNHSRNVYKIMKPKWSVLPTNRFVHLASTMQAKIYMDRENLHAHQVLESSLKTYQIFPDYVHEVTVNTLTTDITGPKQMSTATVDQMFNSFKHLCCYCRQNNVFISEPQFADFTKLYCDRIHLLNDDQLRDSLSLLVMLPQESSVRARNFVELWTHWMLNVVVALKNGKQMNCC